jgi:hypothetical protein
MLFAAMHESAVVEALNRWIPTPSQSGIDPLSTISRILARSSKAIFRSAS